MQCLDLEGVWVLWATMSERRSTRPALNAASLIPVVNCRRRMLAQMWSTTPSKVLESLSSFCSSRDHWSHLLPRALLGLTMRWVCLLLQPVQPGELVKVSQVAPGLPCGWVNLVDGKGVAAAVAIRLAASISARAEALSVLDAPSNRSIHASEVLEIHLRTSGEAALPSLMKVLRNLL
jgi:hypothetical protein